MNNPVVSIYISAIRPFLWEAVYKSIAESNQVSFEIIFVGNVPPEFTLPENCHHIHSGSQYLLLEVFL